MDKVRVAKLRSGAETNSSLRHKSDPYKALKAKCMVLLRVPITVFYFSGG